MFDYTFAAIDKILSDLKKLQKAIYYGMQAFTVLYLTYAIIMRAGIFAANVVLLFFAVAYLVFSLIMGSRKGAKHARKIVQSVYQWCRRLIRLFILSVTVYGLVLAKTNFDPLSLLITAVMLVGWVLEILLYLVSKFLAAEIVLLKQSIHKDCTELPLIGGMIEKSKPLDDNAKENLKILDPIIVRKEEEKKRRKETQKQKKKQDKRDARTAKKRAKQDARATKRQAKQDARATKRQAREDANAQKQAKKRAKKVPDTPPPEHVEELATAESKRKRKKRQRICK